MNINYILRYQSSDYLSTDDFSAIEIQYSIWKPFFHDLQISLLCVGFVLKRSENFKKMFLKHCKSEQYFPSYRQMNVTGLLGIT